MIYNVLIYMKSFIAIKIKYIVKTFSSKKEFIVLINRIFLTVLPKIVCDMMTQFKNWNLAFV